MAALHRPRVPDLTIKPSGYFRRQCFLGVEAEEATATQYLDWFGDDNLVFSTDYPHGDSQHPHAVETFDKLPFPEACDLGDDAGVRIGSTRRFVDAVLPAASRAR